MKDNKVQPLQPDTLTKISQSIIANQIAYDFNHEIKFTRYYKQDLKQKLNQLQPVLAKAEREEYDKFFDCAERASSDTYKAMAEMVQEITSLGLFEFNNIKDIIQAYKKDPKSVYGIAKKVNK